MRRASRAATPLVIRHRVASALSLLPSRLQSIAFEIPFIVAMPPKKKEEAVDDALKKARFGRVSNNLKMGLVSIITALFNETWRTSVAH